MFGVDWSVVLYDCCLRVVGNVAVLRFKNKLDDYLTA